MASLMRFRTPFIIGVAAVVVAVVVLLAWISPEGHKLSTLDSQKQLLSTQEESLQAEIVTLQHDEDQKVTNCGTLDTLLKEVPPTLDEAQFVLDVGQLASSSGASTPSITWGAATAGTGVDTVGVTVTVAGAFGQVMNFVQGIDGSAFARLFTVSTFTVGAPGSNGGGGGGSSSNPVVVGTSLQSPSTANYQVSLSGDIYYSPTQTPTTCSSLQQGA